MLPNAADTPAPWDFAGLLLTYWCNARCAFCYVYSSPERGGSMSRENAIRLWRGLDRLADRHGRRMRVHLAGGEPFGDWPLLLSIVRAARDAGLSTLEKIETNAYWARTDSITRLRLEQLAAIGMEMLLVSADVYHQEFVPPDRVKRCVVIARTVLGRGRVRVRWWDFFNDAQDLRRLDSAGKAELFAAALKHHSERMTGRAADQLAGLRPCHPAAHFVDEKCGGEVLQSRHVHIDPYGHIFPGVCNGIILGNGIVDGVERVWDELAANWRSNPIVLDVVTGGSYRLFERAKALGYKERPEGYAGKCHLCHDVRQYLHERGGFEKWVGPAECYASPSEKRVFYALGRERTPARQATTSESV